MSAHGVVRRAISGHCGAIAKSTGRRRVQADRRQFRLRSSPMTCPYNPAPSWTRPTPRATSSAGSTSVGNPPAAFAPGGDGEPYCIMLPPPNVTGTLHMGHAFQHTLMDTLTRWHRMRGYRRAVAAGHGSRRHRHADGGGAAARRRGQTPPRPGPREVPRARLGVEGTVRRHHHAARCAALGDLGRLVARHASRWIRSLSRAVTEVFVRLHEEGLIYRGKRLVNWDPVLLTARLGSRGAVRGRERLAVAHPLSDRRTAAGTSSSPPRARRPCSATPPSRCIRTTSATSALVGKQLDAAADRPHDPGHRRRLRRRGLRLRLREDHAGARLQRLRGGPAARPAADQHLHAGREAQRERAGSRIAASTASRRASRSSPSSKRAGLLEKIEPHKLKVPRGDRSNAVIEPYLTDQWYVKIAPLAEPALEAVEDGRIRFVPGELVEDLFRVDAQHQGLVRQPPALVGPSHPGLVRRGRQHLRRRAMKPRCAGKHSLGAERRSSTQDADVLDTWFSSALWPFSTLGWPDTTPELQTVLSRPACWSPASTSSSSGSRA